MSLFLFLFFTSCASKRDRWYLSFISPDCPPTTYMKLAFDECDTFNSIQVEFLGQKANLHLYLNALTMTFPYEGQNPHLSMVRICIRDEEFHFLADRLEGGQRLRLPDEALTKVVEALLENCDVSINVGRYQTVLTPDNFAELYTKKIL